MQTILKTKLYTPPVLENLVVRSRLVDLLNHGIGRRLTLISAPAGFGKTTLISEWLNKGQIPFCWISLDENDNDPRRFLTYFWACLNSIGIEVDSEQIKLLQDLGENQIETILNSLINQIADAHIQFRVVLDDYNHIQNQAVHQILRYLLEYLPPQAHLVIATRADPPLPISRLRARGQLTEIRSADLRFDISEGEQFLNQIHALELGTDDVQKLVTRTDGWVAGLQMASIALRGRQNVSDYIARFSGSHDYIVDFLTSEVLEQQSEDIRSFLVKTSILQRLTAPLCEELTGQTDCQQILKNLHTHNIFLQALDDENHWFAYHRLFRDMLTQQLLERYPDKISDLYLKASQWCQKHVLVNDAIEYALQGEHIDRAADLVESHAQATFRQGEIVTFLRWVEKLSQSTVYARPMLCIYTAWAVLIHTQNLESAVQYLDQVRSTDPVVQACRKAVQAIQAGFQNQIPHAIQLAQQALEQLPEGEYFFRQITGWNLSAALFLSGDEQAGTHVLQEVARVSQASGNRMVAVVTLCRLGSIRLQNGDLYQAREHYQQALAVASENRSKPMPAACEAFFGLGKIYWEWYQFRTAEQMLTDGLVLSKQWREFASIDGRITLAHLQTSQGNPDGAMRTIAKNIEIISKDTLTGMSNWYVALHEAHLRLRQGDLHFARAWAEKRDLEKYLQLEKMLPSEHASADVIRDYQLLVYVRILIAEKHYAQALALLSKLLPALLNRNNPIKIIEAQILMGIIQIALGRTSEAIESLKIALKLAAPAGFLRIFLEEGDTVSHLIKRIHKQGESSPLASKILEASQYVHIEPVDIASNLHLIEPLSEREIEILRLLVSELSVPEIASDIHISVSTLRTHIRNIYRKLDTHSRYETVSKAQELNLI